MAVDIAVAHTTTPYVSTYPWSSGFGTKRSNPATLPTGNVVSVSFSPSGADIAVAHSTTPRISTYPWSSGFGTKRSNPATLPASTGRGVAFSPSGADIAVAHSTTPYISTYPWSSGFGTKRSNPATLPTGNGYGVTFSPSGADIAVAHLTTPYISTYPWSSGFGTKRSNPATLPASTGRGVAVSSGGADIAVTHLTTPYISTYPWSSGFGTKRSDPATLPTGNGYGVAFSSGGSGGLSPGTVADDSAHGFSAWSNPGNAAASDDTYATCSLVTGMASHYLKATNFGFAIPSGATIEGIILEVEKKATAAFGNVTDSRVRIVKGGTVGSTDKGTGATWPAADEYVQYGGVADLWGETWTDSDINSSTFGVVIAATTGSVSETASVDQIRLTVFYSEGGGPVQSTGLNWWSFVM